MLTVKLIIALAGTAPVLSCYYGYYQEPPQQFQDRWAALCCKDRDQGSSEFQQCCVPLQLAVMSPDACNSLIVTGQAEGKTCPSEQVQTTDMPKQLQYPAPTTVQSDINIPEVTVTAWPTGTGMPVPICPTTWVTVTATPDCPKASKVEEFKSMPSTEAQAESTAVTQITGVDALPESAPPSSTLTVETGVPSDQSAATTGASTTETSSAESSIVTELQGNQIPTSAAPTETSTVAGIPPPGDGENKPAFDCRCPSFGEGAAPPRLGRRNGGECDCSQAPQVPSSTVETPTSTAGCDCPTGEGSAPPDARKRNQTCQCGKPSETAFDGAAKPPRRRSAPASANQPQPEVSITSEGPVATSIVAGTPSGINGPGGPSQIPCATVTSTKTFTPSCTAMVPNPAVNPGKGSEQVDDVVNNVQGQAVA